MDDCHANGLAVLLDVVYNHLGPEGNYLADYGPYFSYKYRTPWGPAVNFDDRGSDQVRRFVVDNALYWVTEYHLDGLRLDAIHGIFDFSPRHILAEIGDAVHAERPQPAGRPTSIAESDLNDPRVISSRGRRAAMTWTPSGPTTSITRSTPTSQASGPATMSDFGSSRH